MIQAKEKQGKPFKIVCIKAYEFEGTVFNLGDISYNSWGRNIPDNWRKATEQDVVNYQNIRLNHPNQ
jgi:hypothetical protein